MAVVGYEWLLILAFFAIILWYVSSRFGFGRKKKVLQSVIVSMARSRQGITMDDIIMNARVTADEAHKAVQELVSKNVLKMEQKEGRTLYTAV